MFVIKRNQVIITALVVMIAIAGYLNYTDSRIDTPAGFVYSEDGDIQALIPDNSGQPRVVPASSTGTNPLSYDELTNVNVIAEDIGIALTQESNTSDQPGVQPENNTNGQSQNGNAGAVQEGNADAAQNQEQVQPQPEGQQNSQPADETAQNPGEEQSSEPGEAWYVSSPGEATYFVQAKLEREQSRSKQRELLLELINNQNLEQEKKAECADAMLDIQKKIEKESAAEAMIEAKGFSEVFVRIDEDTVDVVVSKEELSDAEIAQIEDIIKRKTGMEAANIRISTMKNN